MNQQPIPTARSRRIIKKRPLSLVKLTLTIGWGSFLLLSTLTRSLEQFLDFQSIGFVWTWHPDVASFFYFRDFSLIHPDYVVVKLGHFIGFAILDLLLYSLSNNHKKAIAFSFTFAFLTEFLQLFLGRDGRLYDLGIDTLGIISVFLIVTVYRAMFYRG